MRVVSVGVASAKESVLPENEDIAPLISGDSTCGLKGFLLGAEVARNPSGARLADGPPFPAWNNILALV